MAGMQTLQAFWDDLQVLKSMWLSRISGSSHKERMDSFYASQADAYDHFRARFLHGRERMLRACAKMIEEMGVEEGLLWVDLGGGTAENVRLMSRYIDLSKFEKIYVVDICGPLCDVARQKSKTLSWTNVEIVEADACNFAPVSKPVTLITFSYSLSMIPDFMLAIDKAISYLDQYVGILAVVDFCTSLKHDIPERQNGYVCRWFWRIIFELHNIDLGPARRQYLDHILDQVYEENKYGYIPYVPLLKIPYCVWLGRKRMHFPSLATNGDAFDYTH
eukprot:c14704_g1_i1 orf=83-910(+)